MTQGLTLAATSRTTVSADAIAGSSDGVLVGGHVAARAAARRRADDAVGSDRLRLAHREGGRGAGRATWYFAEGSQGFFDTFLLLANPTPAANNASVEFLIEGGGAGGARPTPVAAAVAPDDLPGRIPELVNKSFGITVTFDSPAAAERAMYFGTPIFNGGHESAGAPAPSTSWFLAEGATGELLHDVPAARQPGRHAGERHAELLRKRGGLVTRTKTVPARSRLTVNIAHRGHVARGDRGRDAGDLGRAGRGRARDVLAVRRRVSGTRRTTASASPRRRGAGAWPRAGRRSRCSIQTFILLANPDTTAGQRRR